MTIEEQIERALFTRVTTLPVETGGIDLTDHSDEAPFSDGSHYAQSSMSPVAWPNLGFNPPVTSPYLRVTHFRNDNERLFWKGTAPHRRQGILQIIAVAPRDAGPGRATTMAGQIAEHFPADLDLFGDDVRVRIQRAPDLATPTVEDASFNLMVSIRYECFA